MARREYDIVLFGATGFTGEYIARQLLNVAERREVRWAVAGRRRDALEDLVQRLAPEDEPGVIVADVCDPASLESMASRAVCVINAVGPFNLCGTPVVSACIKMRAHYVDIAGEPLFLEQCSLYLNAAAVRNGVAVVSACGFDSIPADLGVAYTVQQAAECGVALTAVESTLTLKLTSRRFKSFVFHSTTWECVVDGLSLVGELRRVRAERAASLPRIAFLGAAPRLVTGWDKVQELYRLPFPGADASVVRRSQESAARPVHYAAYLGVRSRVSSAGLFVIMAVATVLSRWRWGRWLLKTLPALFTLGLFTRGGPSPDQSAATSATMTFRGTVRRDDESGDSPAIETEVTLIDPAYRGTAAIVVACALQVLDGVGVTGVVTPATAFRNTNLIARLNELPWVSFAVKKLPSEVL